MVRGSNFRALPIVAALGGALGLLGVGLPGSPCGRADIALEGDIDSARALAGEPFAFRTVEAATAADGTEIPINSLGHGVIAIAQHAQRGGRGGYIVLEPRYVVLASGALKPSPPASALSRLYQASRSAVSPAPYTVPWVRFGRFVRQYVPPDIRNPRYEWLAKRLRMIRQHGFSRNQAARAACAVDPRGSGRQPRAGLSSSSCHGCG